MQGKTWAPFTRLVWAVMIIGILIVTGAWPWALLVTGLLIIFSLILVAATRRRPAPGKRAEDETLRRYFGGSEGK